MAPIMLAHETVLRSRINHHLEGLAKILQSSEQLGAVQKQHVIVGHAMHDQQWPLQILGEWQH
jgi:hypothetical protein